MDLNSEEYIELLKKIKENGGTIEMPFIDGDYTRSFDDIRIKGTSNSCEYIEPGFKEEEKMLKFTFKIDKSNCGLKWWVILLIVLGIVIILIVILLILSILVKPIRQMIFPYRKGKRKEETIELENTKTSALYKGKTKKVSY